MLYFLVKALIFLITVRRSSFRLCRYIRYVVHRILGNTSCDLGKAQIMYFLINASSSKPLDTTTSTFAGAQVIYRGH